eukprot:IDg16981t1
MEGPVRSSSISTAASGTLCIICFERERDTTLSCGHANVCASCVARFAQAAGASTPRCPTCRAELDLPPILRRPGLRPVRFAAAADARVAPRRAAVPPVRDSRRARSLLTADAVAAIDALHRAADADNDVSSPRRHSSLGIQRARASGALPATAVPATAMPRGGESGARRVLVLALRGVAVDAVCARLRAQAAWRAAGGSLVRRVSRDSAAGSAGVGAGGGAAAETTYVWAALVRSFDAVLRWDAAVPAKLPRIWVAVTASSALPTPHAGGRVSLRMTDVRDAAHCLGAPRTTVSVRLGAKMLGADADVRRLAAIVSRLISASRPPRPPRPALPSTPPSARTSPWALIRQCL